MKWEMENGKGNGQHECICNLWLPVKVILMTLTNINLGVLLTIKRCNKTTCTVVADHLMLT